MFAPSVQDKNLLEFLRPPISVSGHTNRLNHGFVFISMVFDDIPIAARNSKFPENVAETVGPR